MQSLASYVLRWCVVAICVAATSTITYQGIVFDSWWYSGGYAILGYASQAPIIGGFCLALLVTSLALVWAMSKDTTRTDDLKGGWLTLIVPALMYVPFLGPVDAWINVHFSNYTVPTALGLKLLSWVAIGFVTALVLVALNCPDPKNDDCNSS